MEDNFENKPENQQPEKGNHTASDQGGAQQYTYADPGQGYGGGMYQQQYQQQCQDNYNYNVGNNTGYGREYYDGMDSSPLSMGEWVLTLLIMSIPCVNIIMCCIWAFGKTGNINRRNFCRAQLIFIAIGIVLSMIMVAVILATGMNILSEIGGRGSGYYYYY